jgi:glycosyl transferase family 2
VRILAVLTVRNEAAFLLEWLAHHRAVGFTDFLVFSNNCQDGTDILLDHLAAMGVLTHIRNDGPYHKGGIQFTALNDASKMEIVKNADWILALDIDEFVNIHVGDHTITALLAALPDATAITLTWRLFGNNDVVHYRDEPVTETFTRCAPVVMYWPWRSAMFKTLYRNDGTYQKIGVHRPRSPNPDRLDQCRWFDGQGRELDDQFKNRRIFSTYGRPNYRLVQLNHYPLGSMENYVLKADRGRAVHSDHILGVDYWVERNFNTDVDDTIRSVAPQRSEILKDLLGKPDIASHHRQAVDWRKSRFSTLLMQEPFRALFARLLMTPPSRLVSAKDARTLSKLARSGKS